MKRNALFLLALICFGQNVFSQFNYPVSAIPDSLKTDAEAVKRDENISFEVSDLDRAYANVHEVYTVLGKRGEDFLIFNEYTSKYRKLEDAEIKVYNSAGIQIAKYKKKDFAKYSDDDGLIEDGAQYYFKVPANEYPITAEFNYSVRLNGTLSYPAYHINIADQSVEKSVFTAKVPVELGLRYKNQKTGVTPQINNDGKSITYTWSVNNLTAIKYEEGGPKFAFSYPSVLLAPNNFQFYNTRGEMTSWNSFGQWTQSLLTGLDALPDDRKKFFADLTKDGRSEREKVRIVYDYLQKNFRYVSIQLGIGGVKPFPASFTDEKKYGDCKGLSFYMSAVLKSLGIKSYIALINSEFNVEPVDPAFPINQFDHVILCVPQKSDSIWLECTSNTADFAVLGSFTENRNALLITENGGVLVPTPEGRPSENIMTGVTKIELNEDGTGKSNTHFCSTGRFKELFGSVLKAKKDEQKEFLVAALGFRQPDEFEIQNKSKDYECETDLHLEIEKIPQFSSGTKMFLSPRIYSCFDSKLPTAKDRRQDYYFRSCFDKTDTTIYILPSGYVVDALPKPVSKKCEYATYSTDYVYDKEKGQVTSIGRMVLYKNHIPAAKYAEIKSFYDGVCSDAGQKLVIRKS